ncbi:MAG: sugar phosphate isomerase/epimerase family protein [Candidatus Xenobiia bacterium LiM19]
MTEASEIELIASYFTIAGDVYPFGPNEISPFPFKDRVEALACSGWKGIGMILEDLKATAAVVGLAEMRHILDANDMKYVEMEFVVDWFRDGERRKKSDRYRRDILEMAEKLRARDVKIAPGLGVDIAHPAPEDLIPDVPRMTEEFAHICKDAAKHGTNIVLEIMPFSNVRTIEVGRAIVEGAHQPNGGLLLDIWHMARGGNAYTEIAKIPGPLHRFGRARRCGCGCQWHALGRYDLSSPPAG